MFEHSMVLFELTPECRAAAAGRLPPGRPSTIRVFRNGFADRILGRAHPVTPLLWFGAPIALGMYHGATSSSDPLDAAGHFLLGWLLWSLLEYILHRFLFHRSSPSSEVQTFLIHGYHHAFPNDRTRLVAPPLMSWGPALVIALAYRALFGPSAWTVFAGTAFGYVAYDMVHYYAHHGRPRHALGKWLRRYHLTHHHEAASRFGVSSPLWDLVFGTYGAAG